MKVSALVASSALLIGLTASGAGLSRSRPVVVRASNQPLLGVVRPSPVGGSALARLDATTLQPVPGRRVGLGRNTGAWSFSPDRHELAIGVDRALGVRIIDVRRMRRVADVETRNGDVLALAWLTPRRIVGLERVGIFVVDPVARRLVSYRYEHGTLVGWARIRTDLIVLLGPPASWIPVSPVTDAGSAIGPTRLLAIDGQGRVRSVQLDSIQSGSAFDTGEPAEAWVPGLAVDAQGERAFVVGGGAPIAEVDLKTLEVTYHQLREPGSLLDRALEWLAPAAAAKGPISGPTREAVWLGNGLLAIAGVDVHVIAQPRSVEVTTEPFGLKLVDTRSWTARTLEARATDFAYGSGVLFAYAGSFDEQDRPTGGIGATGFALDGTRLFHAFGDSPLFWAEIVGRNAYVAPEGKIVGVDLSSGRVVTALDGPLPQILR